MKLYTIQFVVQGDSLMDAEKQAQRYLNTGDRCVDFNVVEGAKSDQFKPLTRPLAADYIRKG